MERFMRHIYKAKCEFKPPAMFVLFISCKSGFIKSCSPSEDLPAYKSYGSKLTDENLPPQKFEGTPFLNP
jgi:hypothetical protein